MRPSRCRPGVALGAGLLVLTACTGDPPDREQLVTGGLPEPTPYTVPTTRATDALPVLEPSAVRAPGDDQVSRPWDLIRLWDGGRRLAVQYSAGCDDEVDVRFAETPSHVLIQVLDDADDSDCRSHRVGSARAILALSAPLGARPLLHAPTSASDDRESASSLAELYEDVPPWPGEPWFQDGREVTHSELTVAAGPEHCDWQEAAFLSGYGLEAPRDSDGRLWTRDPQGVLEHFPRAEADFRAHAVLPADAVDTGYRQGHVELWTAPSDAAAYVYLVNAADRDDVERWVRGGGGCA